MKFRKVDVRVWNDEKFMSLSRDGKLVFLFLLTHPSQTMLGAMRASLPGLASELGMAFKEFSAALLEIVEHDMVRFDEKASFVWFPNWLRYNRPESPNVVRSWSKVMPLLPECKLKRELVKKLQVFIGGLPAGFREGFREVFGQPSLNQEQEQEPEQEPEQRRSKAQSTSTSKEKTGTKEKSSADTNAECIDAAESDSGEDVVFWGSN